MGPFLPVALLPVLNRQSCKTNRKEEGVEKTGVPGGIKRLGGGRNFHELKVCTPGSSADGS